MQLYFDEVNVDLLAVLFKNACALVCGSVFVSTSVYVRLCASVYGW